VTTVANGIVLRDRTLLLCKRRHERLLYPDCWGLPGGHIEPGEAIEHALVRELREELGVTPTVFRRMSICRDTAPGANTETTYHIYLVSDWEGGDPVMLGDEHSEIRWFETEAACELRNLALPVYKWLFRSLPLAPPRSQDPCPRMKPMPG
jgi:8-oxo-dGTP diphosphatase